MAGIRSVFLLWSAALLGFIASVECRAQGLQNIEHDHDIESWKTQGWVLDGRVPSQATLKLTFALKQRNLAALEKLFWQVSDPDSRFYGRHWSLEQLSNLISPSKKTESVIKKWLRASGIVFERCTSVITRDFLTCEMPRETAENLLPGATFHYFRHSKLSKPVIRSTHHYSVPFKVAQHLDFVGGVLRFPAVNWAPAKAKREDFGSNDVKDVLLGDDIGIHIGVYPSVLRDRYNVSDTVGSHPNNSQCIAQFLEQFYSPTDLKEFFLLFGGSFTHLDKVAKVIGPDSGRPGVEASLDTQYIMSLGANITTWFWSTGGRHEKQEPFLEWLVAISNNSQVPWVHSVSYGDNEDSLSADYMRRISTEFQKAGVRGLTLLFASGDDGANCIANKKFRPSFPASSPYVTTVGGTAFNNPFTISGEYGYEISGGGFSDVFSQPAYQSAVVEHYLKTGPNMPADSFFNKSGRAYPDVAALCNHFWVVNNKIPVPGILGTSASTPTVAGIVSLLNDVRFHNNKPSMGFLNPFIYKNPSVFYDVTTGHNEGCDPGDRGFTASTGWDPVTGFGSPNYPALAKAILE
ncbi:predicted protein [Nematostella vectensis]|uniref:Tripeptidyl-peptidase 1 n=1 Tax=Nematostella vectensis TaxID=45351 RepID=A7S3J9_NEMVE|nr:tripeptidyl-peptidase 1 [Nematostella vectensis]EDO41785.1 predicted protein [Nematostella vectensis]|eukprot:XP_001633848.1 predicted protein [Nematostella vectensis]